MESSIVLFTKRNLTRNITIPAENEILETFLPVYNQFMFISDDVVHIITLVNIVIIACALSIFGIVANVMNIIVFANQGFQESINISFCSLAVSDLLSVVTLLWITICYNPLLANADIPFLPREVEIFTGNIPHVTAINISGWLTAFVTLERCFCIAFPLKVKDILNPLRTKIIVVAIFCSMVMCQIPTFYITRLGWKFSPERNRTVFGVIFDTDNDQLFIIIYFVINVIVPLSNFTVVFVCTVIVIVKLNQKSKWRKEAKVNEKSSSTRDLKVVKMVVTVAVIFLISFTPNMVIFILMAKEPEFNNGRIYQNNFMLALDFALMAEAVNGSVNIFVYYSMSTRYRLIFRSVFFGEKTVS